MNPSWKLGLLLAIVLTTSVREGLGIQCWECRSDFDPQCADPFDNTTISITDCSLKQHLPHLPGVDSTICRKTRQLVNGNWKVIRGCGYLTEPDVGENKMFCFTRTTNPTIVTEYCTCNKDRCNV